MELVYTIIAVAALSLAFFGMERSSVRSLRVFGPWLLVLVACVVIMIAKPPTLEPYTWAAVQRPSFLSEMIGGFTFLVPFAVEAVLVSRALLRMSLSPVAFVACCVVATLGAWLVTLLAWTVWMPGS